MDHQNGRKMINRVSALPLRRTLLHALLATVGVACSTNAFATTIAPRTLLEQTLQAHARIGPCYIASTAVESGASNYPDSTTHITMRRNSEQQFTMREVTPRYTRTYYVTGGWVIDYWAGHKTFERRRADDLSNADNTLFGTLFHIREALRDSAKHPQLGRTRVTPIDYHGESCYKIVWDKALADDDPLRHPPADYKGPLPGAYIAPFHVMIVGRDGLVRKVVTDQITLPWKTMTQTITYHMRRRPYPASIFVFVPPPGVKQRPAA